jgi:hypothetical protein
MAWDTTYDIRFQGANSILENTEDKLTTRRRTRILAEELRACGELDLLEEGLRQEVPRRPLRPIRRIATIGKKSAPQRTKWIQDANKNRPSEKLSKLTEDSADKANED